MTSEQMRMELELFVNKGLKEGWRGWPLKNQHPGGERFRSPLWDASRHLYSSIPIVIDLLGHVQQQPVGQMTLSSPQIWRVIRGSARESRVN